jgi:hypothetical protein
LQVGEFPGRPGGGKDEVLQVRSGGESHQTSVRLPSLVGTQNSQFLRGAEFKENFFDLLFFFQGSLLMSENILLPFPGAEAIYETV